jgi:hypothetical protein
MLDDNTRSRCHSAAAVAERNGWDLFETMDRLCLLTTDDQRRQVEIRTVQSLWSQLDQQQDFLLASLGGDQTVTGAVRGVMKFIELYAQTLEK